MAGFEPLASGDVASGLFQHSLARYALLKLVTTLAPAEPFL